MGAHQSTCHFAAHVEEARPSREAENWSADKVRVKIRQVRNSCKSGNNIKCHLEAGELKEAWWSLKGWYVTSSARSPKPCYASMEKQIKEREELYQKVSLPGDLISFNVKPFNIED